LNDEVWFRIAALPTVMPSAGKLGHGRPGAHRKVSRLPSTGWTDGGAPEAPDASREMLRFFLEQAGPRDD
jgi:hypothetical protein